MASDADLKVGVQRLRVRLLGGFGVEGLDERTLGTRKARVVMKRLALALGMAVLHKPGHSVGRNGARALGYRLVFDYEDDQLGVKVSSQGFVQIEGEWYCPSIHLPLIDATSDFREGGIDEATYQVRLAERWGYLARPKGTVDSEGHVRLMCPAPNPWPLARCDLKPASVRAETRGRTRIHLRADVAANPAPSCSQQSVTVPPKPEPSSVKPALWQRGVAWHLRHLAQHQRGLQRLCQGRRSRSPRRRGTPPDCLGPDVAPPFTTGFSALGF